MLWWVVLFPVTAVHFHTYSNRHLRTKRVLLFTLHHFLWHQRQRLQTFSHTQPILFEMFHFSYKADSRASKYLSSIQCPKLNY